MGRLPLAKSPDSNGNGIPDNADISLFSRTVSTYKNKIGFRDYDPDSDPPSYYLVQTTNWTDIKGVTGENGEINGVGPGSDVETTARPAGTTTTQHSGEGSWSVGSDEFEDPTFKKETLDVSSYDDPPNQEEDEPGTVDVSAKLTEEYTTAMLKDDAIAALPNFTPAWYNYGAYASQGLSTDEYAYSLTNLEYKFKIGPDAGEADIRWLEGFTPYDDPETTTVDESKNRTAKVKNWKGTATETPTYSINPHTDAPDSYGTYQVLPLEIKAHQDSPGPEGSAPKYNNAPRLGNATNLLSVWPNEEIILKVKIPYPFNTVSEMPAGFITWNAPGHTIAANTLDASLHWPLVLGGDPIKVVKITIGGVEFQVRIKIQNVGILGEVEAAALVPNAGAVMAYYRQEAIDYGVTFPEGPQQDAMRHGYWCALAVSTTGVTAGDVELVYYGHEHRNRYDDHQQAFNSTMDIKNNAVGTTVNHTVAGHPDRPPIQQDLNTHYTGGDMYIWQIPPGAASHREGDSEGILLKSDRTRIYP